jgi:hypothetical protein
VIGPSLSKTPPSSPTKSKTVSSSSSSSSVSTSGSVPVTGGVSVPVPVISTAPKMKVIKAGLSSIDLEFEESSI